MHNYRSVEFKISENLEFPIWSLNWENGLPFRTFSLALDNKTISITRNIFSREPIWSSIGLFSSREIQFFVIRSVVHQKCCTPNKLVSFHFIRLQWNLIRIRVRNTISFFYFPFNVSFSNYENKTIFINTL